MEGSNIPVVAQPVSESNSDAALSLPLLNPISHGSTGQNSSAADQLNSQTSSLVDELKERLSDFASCVESDEPSNDEKDDGFLNVDEKKRHRKNKRKTRESPNKEVFLKKPNLLQK